MGRRRRHLGWAVAAVVLLATPAAGLEEGAGGPTHTLEELTVLPEAYGGPLATQGHAPGQEQWLETIDPGLAATVIDAVAMLPGDRAAADTLLTEHGISLVQGLRFATPADARAAWEAIRGNDPGAGARRFDLDGLGGVHVLEARIDAMEVAGWELGESVMVESYRLVGRDLYVLPIVGDEADALMGTARDILSWHATRFPNDIEPVRTTAWGWRIWTGAALLVAVAVAAVLRRRRGAGDGTPSSGSGLGPSGFSAG